MTYDGVDIPWNEFRLGEEGEPLVDSAALHVDIFSTVEEVETYAAQLFILTFGILRSVLVSLTVGLHLLVGSVRQCDAVFLQQVDVEPACLGEIFHERLCVGLRYAVLNQEFSGERLRAVIAAFSGSLL